MNFKVYKSSAGSGKTFSLVVEYLCIVLNNPEKYNRILAITFTNKAAAELKERIISALAILSYQQINQDKNVIKYMLPEIIQQSGLSKEKIEVKAKNVLQLLLHKFDDFAVSTIDSFTFRIIKTFAFDLHIPMDFSVELDQDSITDAVIDNLISQAGINKILTKSLVQFTQSKIEDDRSWQIENELKETAKLLFAEDDQEILQALMDTDQEHFFSLYKEISRYLMDFENSLAKIGSKGIALIDDHQIDYSSFAGGRLNGITKYFLYLKTKQSKSYSPTPTLTKYINSNQWHSGKAKKNDCIKIDSIQPALEELFNEARKYVKKYYEDYKLLKQFLPSVFPIALLREIKKLQEEFKHSNNILHISDFNSTINKIILQEPIPFIYERLGEKYQHLLIDEFQDTSILQWHNLLPLVENSLANGKSSIIVGDGKQAIYRFRNGRVEQFINLPRIFNKPDEQHFDEKERTLVRDFTEKKLHQNFRSKAAIVEFNNQFFSFISQILPDALAGVYEDCKQKVARNQKGGMVSIEFFQTEKDSNSWKQLHLQAVNKSIVSCISENYNYSDITVLCRTNKEAVQVATYLLNMGQPVISTESLLLSNSPKVRFIQAWAIFSCMPLNKVNQLNLLYLAKELGYLSETCHHYIDQLKNTSDPKNFISDLFIQLGYSVNIFLKGFADMDDFYESILRIFNLTNGPSDPYLQFFMDEVIAYKKNQSSALIDYIMWFEENASKLSITIPQGINAINVMTIHKAKGLEFPVVIYPFASQRSIKLSKRWIQYELEEIPHLNFLLLNLKKEFKDSKFSSIYHHEEGLSLLDHLNVLYVALTRAQDRLYIFSNLVEKKPKEAVYTYQHLFSNFLKDKGVYSNSKNTYIFGDKKDLTNLETKNPIEFKGFNYLSGSWRSKLVLRKPAVPQSFGANNISSADRGTLIHSILSKVNNIKELDDFFDKIKQHEILDETLITDIYNKLNTFLQLEGIKFFFAQGDDIRVFIEKEIYYNGEILRPDRLLISGENLYIIDFKTGLPKDEHKIQLSLYARALSELGYNNIHKVLLYIDLKNPIVYC